MKRLVALALLLLALQAKAQDARFFERYFTGETMRLDYFHTGTKGEERLSLDQVYEEGPWSGSRVNLLDTLNLGEYIVRVFDIRTNAIIFSRGFSSMFNEWQTTDEAATGVVRSFSATVRFPFPRGAVQVEFARRDRRMVFHTLASMTIDPTVHGSVTREPHQRQFPVVTLTENGDPAEKVDILILGDGYTKGEMEKFVKDAKHLNEVMFSTSPFKERKRDFNVRAIEVESGDSGIDVPDREIWRNNALGCRYSTFGLARYVLTTENRTLRDIAGTVPYDFLCILVNDTRYGGGGIYNLYATTYTKEQVKGAEWQSDYMYVHEFGHSFAGLGDEYYTSTTAYNDFYPAGIEPWEPNLTALDSGGEPKWKGMVSPGIAIPTPWEKARYDSIEAVRAKMDRLAPDYYEKSGPLRKAAGEVLKDPRFAGKVGAFEGAGYVAKGLYRPSIDCRMFSLSLAGFDPVCDAALRRMIDFYSR